MAGGTTVNIDNVHVAVLEEFLEAATNAARVWIRHRNLQEVYLDGALGFFCHMEAYYLVGCDGVRTAHHYTETSKTAKHNCEEDNTKTDHCREVWQSQDSISNLWKPSGTAQDAGVSCWILR